MNDRPLSWTERVIVDKEEINHYICGIKVNPLDKHIEEELTMIYEEEQRIEKIETHIYEIRVRLWKYIKENYGDKNK